MRSFRHQTGAADLIHRHQKQLPSSGCEWQRAEIKKIADIYTSAIAIIIHEDGDADQDPLGLLNISPPRELEKQCIYPF